TGTTGRRRPSRRQARADSGSNDGAGAGLDPGNAYGSTLLYLAGSRITSCGAQPAPDAGRNTWQAGSAGATGSAASRAATDFGAGARACPAGDDIDPGQTERGKNRI